MRPLAWLGPIVLVLAAACGLNGSASPPEADRSAATSGPSPTGIASPSTRSPQLRQADDQRSGGADADPHQTSEGDRDAQATQPGR